MKEFKLEDFYIAVEYVHKIRSTREREKIKGKCLRVGTLYMFSDKKSGIPFYIGQCRRNPTSNTNVATRLLAHIEEITNLGLIPKYSGKDLRKRLYEYKICGVKDFFKNIRVYILEEFSNENFEDMKKALSIAESKYIILTHIKSGGANIRK